MDIEEKINLVKRSPTEEIIQEQELNHLFQTNNAPKHYLGIELSGILHIGSLLITGFKINDFIKAGLKTSVYLADWHSFINNKFHGNWNEIQKIIKYYDEAFRFFCPGVQIIQSEELYHNNDNYWKNFIQFSKHMTLPRAVRCLTIMGRNEKDQLDHVPESLIKLIGEIEFSFEFTLDTKRKLLRYESSEVMRNLQDNGFFLQMPPNGYKSDNDGELNANLQGF